MHSILLFCDYIITLSPYIQIKYWNIPLFMKSIDCNTFLVVPIMPLGDNGVMWSADPPDYATTFLIHTQGILKISSPYLETVKRYKQLNIISSISKATLAVKGLITNYYQKPIYDEMRFTILEEITNYYQKPIYDEMRFTILEEIKSTLPKSLFYNYYSQIKSIQMLVFDERGKPEYPGKNLSWQSREPTNSIQIWHRVRKSNPRHIGGRQVLSPLGQPCHQMISLSYWWPVETTLWQLSSYNSKSDNVEPWYTRAVLLAIFTLMLS